MGIGETGSVKDAKPQAHADQSASPREKKQFNEALNHAADTGHVGTTQNSSKLTHVVQQRDVAFLKGLAKWPHEAHQQWKRLGLAERMAVLEHMGKYYGRDFAAKFLQHTTSPTHDTIHFGPGFPEHTPQWFQNQGYRLAQTGAGLDSVIEWWVHPSGKQIMKIRELGERTPPPPPPVVDPPPDDFPTEIPDPIDYSRPQP